VILVFGAVILTWVFALHVNGGVVRIIGLVYNLGRGSTLFDFATAKRISRRLLAVVAILALALLSTHSVSHWHVRPYDTDNCKICHVGHAAIPQTAVQVAQEAPTPVAHLAIDDESVPHRNFVGTPSIPRAPPA
jgi:hypothetical protein